MKPVPSGRLMPTADGNDLILTRTFRAPIDDVWASVTESERTARWFGPWEGDAAPGRTIRVRMAFEEGEAWTEVRVDACEPPRRLAVSTSDEAGDWRMELRLSESAGTTELQFVHHLTTTKGLGEIGPGWEYYLDMLVASRDGTPAPGFDDYYPSQQAYFESLADQRPS
ncbi:SRPBCC family protein [Streptomyces sp. NPDC050982]|uniref:SRPBCC family protein n=1 Tax=Streptomyces sp. NPDC050982 TaxID=3154746 RepID=UPI0033DCFCAD